MRRQLPAVGARSTAETGIAKPGSFLYTSWAFGKDDSCAGSCTPNLAMLAASSWSSVGRAKADKSVVRDKVPERQKRHNRQTRSNG